jgi:hypothetical protein
MVGEVTTAEALSFFEDNLDRQILENNNNYERLQTWALQFRKVAVYDRHLLMQRVFAGKWHGCRSLRIVDERVANGEFLLVCQDGR